MKEEKKSRIKRFFENPYTKFMGAYLAIAGTLLTIGPDCDGIEGRTSGTAQKPKLEERVELPKIKLDPIEKPNENYLDILVDLNQKLGDQRETLTKVDLPNLLKGSKIGPTRVNQYLRFAQTIAGQSITLDEDPKTRTVIQRQNNKDQNGNFLFFKDGDPIFDYELEFEEGFETEVDKYGNLTDLIGRQLNILGERYKVIKAKTDGNGVDLTLVSGEVFDTVKNGELKTYTVDGKDYTIEILSKAIFGKVAYKINGQETPELDSGDSFTLKDGTIFTQLDTDYSYLAIWVGGNPPQQKSDAIFSYVLGSSVIKLSDFDATDNKFEGKVEINNEPIEEAVVRIKGQKLPNNRFEIIRIDYRLSSDGITGDVYVPKGQGLREHLDEPEGLLSPTWDLQYVGKHKNGKHIIRIPKLK